MSEILHGITLVDGSVANTVAATEVINEMYPVGMTDMSDIYMAMPKIDENGLELVGINSALRFSELSDSRTAVSGNTVTRGCPIAQDCGKCVLAGIGLTTAEMSRKNCARANTATAFELAGQEPRGRFVLLPTGKQSFVVNAESFVAEYNADELLQNRLRSAPAVVFTESWLREQQLDQVTIGMNGADGSFGVATAEIEGERLIIPFCSMRQNMGDRAEDDQILRQALTAYFDNEQFSTEKRQQVLSDLNVSITLSASAALENFAHKIQVPRDDSADEAEKRSAALLRGKYPDLIERAGGKITSAIVLNDQYPGAMERHSIFPELEAKMGIHITPITPDNCPGDGQSCHIDYRSETRYALETQLEKMGIPEANIHYDDSQALDPASPNNKLASNRAEQNNGVEVSKKVNNTNRTLNAMIVKL